MNDEEHKFDLGFAKMQIKAWSKWYFRKNSKKQAAIKLRAYCPGLEQVFWKYYLELHIEAKIETKIRISPEAFDSLNSNPELERDDYPGIQFVTLKQINKK